MKRLLTPGKLALAGTVLLAVVVGVLAFAPASETYIFLPDRAHPVEPLVSVEGGKDPADEGGIYFVDVIVRRATLLERFFPGIREGSSLVPAHIVNPSGVSDAERRRGNRREMSRSQTVAAAVALRELGYKVKATPTGVLVTDVDPRLPAARKLRAGDVVVAVEGRRVRTPRVLRHAIGRYEPGDRIELIVRRGRARKQLSVQVAAAPDEPRRPVIGVFVEQEADIDLPLSVRINAGQVGGPSAGLAFALDVLEELGRDVDRGHRVAVTGALELDGDVVPIGGVRQKTVGARRTDVDVFVVPAGDNAREARRHAKGLRVIAVESFQQALQKLATLPPKRQD